MDFKKIIKYFVGGAVAGAICMFFTKLYFGTQWRSDDIQAIIAFGFIGLLFLLPQFKKKSQFMKKSHKIVIVVVIILTILLNYYNSL